MIRKKFLSAAALFALLPLLFTSISAEDYKTIEQIPLYLNSDSITVKDRQGNIIRSGTESVTFGNISGGSNYIIDIGYSSNKIAINKYITKIAGFFSLSITTTIGSTNSWAIDFYSQGFSLEVGTETTTHTIFIPSQAEIERLVFDREHRNQSYRYDFDIDINYKDFYWTESDIYNQDNAAQMYNVTSIPVSMMLTINNCILYLEVTAVDFSELAIDIQEIIIDLSGIKNLINQILQNATESNATIIDYLSSIDSKLDDISLPDMLQELQKISADLTPTQTANLEEIRQAQSELAEVASKRIDTAAQSAIREELDAAGTLQRPGNQTYQSFIEWTPERASWAASHGISTGTPNAGQAAQGAADIALAIGDISQGIFGLYKIGPILIAVAILGIVIIVLKVAGKIQ